MIKTHLKPTFITQSTVCSNTQQPTNPNNNRPNQSTDQPAASNKTRIKGQFVIKMDEDEIKEV